MVDIMLMALKKGEPAAQQCLFECQASFDRELVHVIFDTAIDRPPDIQKLVVNNRSPAEMQQAGPKTLERIYEAAHRNIDARRVCSSCSLVTLDVSPFAPAETARTIRRAVAIAKSAFGCFQLNFPRVKGSYTLPLMWVSLIAHSATWFGTYVPPEKHHKYAEDEYVPLLAADRFAERRYFVRGKFHAFCCECLALRVKEKRVGTTIDPKALRTIERGYREIMLSAVHTEPVTSFRL